MERRREEKERGDEVARPRLEFAGRIGLGHGVRKSSLIHDFILPLKLDIYTRRWLDFWLFWNLLVFAALMHVRNLIPRHQ
jgi:hypothetical protein